MAGAVEAAPAYAPGQPPKPHGQPARKGRGKSNGKPQAEPQVPPGDRLNARSARVKKAITDLLHPSSKSGGEGRQGGQEQRGGALGILERIRRAARERLHQIQGRNQGGSQQGGGLPILEMLR
ncbi:MAG TPA: hypothetical protein VGF09_06065 [Solirubrobacterales bacterium]